MMALSSLVSGIRLSSASGYYLYVDHKSIALDICGSATYGNFYKKQYEIEAGTDFTTWLKQGVNLCCLYV